MYNPARERARLRRPGSGVGDIMQFHIDPHGEPVLARITGLVSIEAWDTVLQEMEAALAVAASDRLFVDLSGLVGWLGLPERTAVGTLMSRRLARMRKVALVIEQHKISGAVETEAQSKGLDLRLFSNRDEAARWALA